MSKKVQVMNTEVEGLLACVSFSPADFNQGTRCNFSFFVRVNDEIGVEYDPVHGPVTLIRSASFDDVGAKKHFVFDYYDGDRGHWDQSFADSLNRVVHNNLELIYEKLVQWGLEHCN